MRVLQQPTEEAISAAVAELQEVGQTFYRKNWSLATSSNYSAVVGRDPLRLVLTASGKDKGQLTRSDFVIVDDKGEFLRAAIQDGSPPGRPSAETMLHVALAKLPNVGSVMHTHSVWSTILSDRFLS